jgi:ABC-2 type transport system ATP-binding protein
MSIAVKNLVKTYGTQRALNDVSFTVEAGEIVGFLGPNGAGKSTTFKIATGYVPATSGSVTVAGFSVQEQPRQVKQRIGYLPEHNPLYLDMFVHEYLHFVGGLYGIKKKELKSRVAEMVDHCGLTSEQNKKMETLSKGYRQRVGLAQALIHNPSVLILDEPSSGLDPNQLVEIRKLIKEVSEQKTVIFSTHIMQEVEALCDRVVIINKGQIVADDRLSNLLRSTKKATFVVEFEGTVAIELIKAISSIEEVVPVHNQTTHLSGFRISGLEASTIRADVFRLATDRQLSMISFRQEQQNLESIFQEFTNPAA